MDPSPSSELQKHRHAGNAHTCMKAILSFTQRQQINLSRKINKWLKLSNAFLWPLRWVLALPYLGNVTGSDIFKRQTFELFGWMLALFKLKVLSCNYLVRDFYTMLPTITIYKYKISITQFSPFLPHYRYVHARPALPLSYLPSL